MQTQNASTESNLERRQAYDRFIETIAGVFDVDMEHLGPKMDASWDHLKQFPVEVWRQLERVAPVEWSSWPKNMVFKVKETIEAKHLQALVSSARSFCEYCNGNGFFSGVIINPNYFQDRALKTSHMVICKGCDNHRAVLGANAIKECHRLYPLEAVTGEWPYTEVVIYAPPGEVWAQAEAWKKVNSRDFASRYISKAEERSQTA